MSENSEENITYASIHSITYTSHGWILACTKLKKNNTEPHQNESICTSSVNQLIFFQCYKAYSLD